MLPAAVAAIEDLIVLETADIGFNIAFWGCDWSGFGVVTSHEANDSFQFLPDLLGKVVTAGAGER